MGNRHTSEDHRSQHSTWLRAAILGANDGLVSVSALILGVIATSASTDTVITAGVAGLVAGALSMAAGEYVSVGAQRDAEQADITIERNALIEFPKEEFEELADIYVQRGVSADLANEVARQMHDHDALGAHLRDELNIDPERPAKPAIIAGYSAVSFVVGAALPLGCAIVSAQSWLVVVVTLAGLCLTGYFGARVAGAPAPRAMLRVLAGGGFALAISIAIGSLVGSAGL